jgi:N-acetylmuramoyl-L-alanine amidase
MQAILIYLLKVIICSSILFLYYHIALRNKRFHYYNRFYLLMSVALSLILPFLNITLWQFDSNNKQVIHLMNVVAVNTTEVSSKDTTYMLSWDSLLLLLYVMVTLFMVTVFLIGIKKLYHYRRIYPVENLSDIIFINTDLQQAPFSFFNNLFWKNTLNITDATGRQIFKHELTHIEQKHSWDKMFLRITTILFWMNPFFWLMQKELSMIHEFIADEKAIENKSAEAFAMMLLQSQYSKNIFSPAQSFSYSPIKRRLFMLTTSAKTSYSYVRRILVLPLLAATVSLFAFKLKENQQTGALSHTNAPFTLLIDAGHGGSADGVIGINGEKEKDIDLSISKKMQELAPEYGITVKMTRTEDVTMDPKMRMDVIEAVHPDALVSIHVSTTSEQQTSNDEVNVYITKEESNNNHLQSRLLGSSVLQATKNDFPTNTTLKQRKEQGIYILDHNPYPAIIIECGYINNTDNVKQLQDAVKVEQLARDILQGVVTYANAPHQTTNASITDTTKNQPLYILNGKTITAEQAKAIDANTIESVNVLKGEDAVKQYGDKGKNGVVVITLKSANSSPSTNSIKPKDADAVKEAEKALKVIDGKIVTNEELQKLDANSIYSISVLKDEATVKEYGEKGKNGVIEITTKKQHNRNIQNEPSNINAFGVNANEQNTAFEPASTNATSDTSLIPPQFPGGKEGWLQFLQKNLKSDVPTQHGAPTGTYSVIVSFKVAEDGTVSDVKADNDPGYGTGAEAVRVIKEGPKWIPAQQNGHAVATMTRQTISFRIEEGR